MADTPTPLANGLRDAISDWCRNGLSGALEARLDHYVDSVARMERAAATGRIVSEEDGARLFGLESAFDLMANWQESVNAILRAHTEGISALAKRIDYIERVGANHADLGPIDRLTDTEREQLDAMRARIAAMGQQAQAKAQAEAKGE